MQSLKKIIASICLGIIAKLVVGEIYPCGVCNGKTCVWLGDQSEAQTCQTHVWLMSLIVCFSLSQCFQECLMEYLLDVP